MKKAETKEICEKVSDSVKLIAEIVTKSLNIQFKSLLSGSFAENTKCFAPDEFDFILECLTRLGEDEKIELSLKVYHCIDQSIRSSTATNTRENEKFILKSLIYGDKISYLHIIWNGDEFQDLNITVDIAICFKDKVVKRLRHFRQVRVLGSTFMRDTHHIQERKMMKDLPKNVLNGFILAKAVRMASIAQPDNLQSFKLQESIKSDDVISSFILKACLFGYSKQKVEFNSCLAPYDVALHIYELLLKYLNERQVTSECSRENPVDCSFCQVERGCCKQRKLMIAMAKKILQWLKENKGNLQDINFQEKCSRRQNIDRRHSLRYRIT